MSTEPTVRLPVTAEGTSNAAFEPLDWTLVAFAVTVWGASFLLIAEGLEAMAPGVVAWLRIAFGLLALSLVPTARRTPIARQDLGRVALLGLVWFAIPMTMFPVAEQWVSSSVAGMLNGSLPLFAAIISASLLRRPPGTNQVAGLLVGFLGVVLVSIPSIGGGSRTALGVALVIVAMLSYGVATNVVVPLSQRYGSIAVIWRALMFGLVLTTPYALIGLPHSSIALRPLGAVFVLGAVGTGAAFVVAGTLMSRVGATRGTVIAYIIPVVALVLGVVIRNDHVATVAIVGLGLVLVGAWLTSRSGR